jgi:hypothetical protein
MLLNDYLWRCLLDDGRLFTVAIIGVTRRAAVTVTVTAALAAALLAFISTVMVTCLVLALSSLIFTVAIKTF